MMCRTRAERIIEDVNQPNKGLFSLLRSKSHCSEDEKAKTERIRRSLFPQAIRVLNQ